METSCSGLKVREGTERERGDGRGLRGPKRDRESSRTNATTHCLPYYLPNNYLYRAVTLRGRAVAETDGRGREGTRRITIGSMAWRIPPLSRGLPFAAGCCGDEPTPRAPIRGQVFPGACQPTHTAIRLRQPRVPCTAVRMPQSLISLMRLVLGEFLFFSFFPLLLSRLRSQVSLPCHPPRRLSPCRLPPTANDVVRCLLRRLPPAFGSVLRHFARERDSCAGHS